LQVQGNDDDSDGDGEDAAEHALRSGGQSGQAEFLAGAGTGAGAHHEGRLHADDQSDWQKRRTAHAQQDRCQQQRSKVAAHQHEALGDQADPERHRYQFVVAAFREFSQLSESLIFKYIFVA
jgi:hypothetical protein